jgi:hypothetical protein
MELDKMKFEISGRFFVGQLMGKFVDDLAESGWQPWPAQIGLPV